MTAPLRISWRPSAGMEPQAIVKVAWGDATEQPRPQFAFLCSAAPMLLDAQQVGLRGGRQAPPAGRGEACVFLASFDGEWEHLVDGEAAPAFRPARPLDTGEHTLRVRAVDGRGAPPYPQTPLLYRTCPCRRCPPPVADLQIGDLLALTRDCRMQGTCRLRRRCSGSRWTLLTRGRPTARSGGRRQRQALLAAVRHRRPAAAP